MTVFTKVVKKLTISSVYLILDKYILLVKYQTK